MTRTSFAAAITLAATIAFSGAALAANGETALGNCYNRVIAACNQGNHPIPCAESGLDQCDDEFGQAIFDPKINKFRAVTPHSQVALLLPAVQAAK